jgi:predicted phage terminase large subunit-like protein
MTETDYGSVIKECAKQINVLFKGKGWTDDEKVTRLFDIYHTAIWSQVHSVLEPLRTEKSEKQIRDILAKYVIGYTNNKTSFVGAIQPIKSKLAQISKKKAIDNEFLARYLELYDKFMALASFRSFKHYCLYMQSIFGFTLWEDTQNCFDGYWYYANKMVLDGEIKFLEKQLPTGFGKSLSDCFMQSWIFGIDIDNDILKVCGNDKFTDDCFQNVIKLMISDKYAKVFPYYSQFDCEIDKMFQFCSRKDLKFSIAGSKKSTNLRIVTKLSDVNGVRAKFLFLDDITQRKDMSNLTMHNKDIHSFSHEWFERNYNRNLFYIVASGTTYSQFDLLSFLKRVMGGEKAVKSKINKYTHIGVSDYIVPNGKSVFVCVPLLDYDTDESTYPKKISTHSARKKREENPTEFWAMDMQRPLPPDSSPFYFTKLRQYTTLPIIGENGRLETCIGALDTKRRGKDFLSMPIFFEANDPEREKQTAFFLVDWLYDDRPMKECIPLIVSKIIQHKITRLYVERNTEECIETLLTDKLKEKGYTSCVIEEVYSTEPKDRRIMSAEGDIKSRLIFPQYGMYSQSSDIGKALLNVYGYTYVGTVAHDDAPDSLALFVKRFVMNMTMRYAKISSFER